jgi:hypothetical protein
MSLWALLTPALWGMAQEALQPTAGDEGGAPRPMVDRTGTETISRDLQRVEQRLERLVLVLQAMWSLATEKTGLTENDLLRRVTELDAQDGATDGRVTKPPVPCSKCGAMICRKFNRCLFCGQEYAGGSALDTV